MPAPLALSIVVPTHNSALTLAEVLTAILATDLPRECFELVIVSRYLQRDLFPALGRSLVPGGVILYETFTEAQRAFGSGPTSPDHLLAAGELDSGTEVGAEQGSDLSQVVIQRAFQVALGDGRQFLDLAGGVGLYGV